MIDTTGFAYPKNPAVRLEGDDMGMLRLHRLEIDKGRCTECHVRVRNDIECPDWHPLRAHLAHIQGRGANGSDTVENTRILCGDCHRKEHSGQIPRVKRVPRV